MGIFGGPTDPNRITIEEERIVGESSSTLIPKAAGRGGELLEGIERALTLFVPDIEIESKKRIDVKNPAQRHDSRDGLLRDAIFAHAKYPINGRVVFSVQDYGKDLIFSVMAVGSQFDDIGRFEKEVVRAYFGLVNEASAAAVELFAKEIKQDFAKIKMGKGLIDIV